MAGKPGKIVLKSDKKGTFEKSAFQILYDNKAKVGGNAGYFVLLAADHFKEAGRTDLSAVTADEMKEALAAIVARHKPQEGEGDDREDFRDFHSDAANEMFARGEWRNKFRVSDAIAYTKSLGYSKDKPAGPDVVNAFVALMDARKEELKKLLDEQPDKDAILAACQASRHRGEAKPFQPSQRYAIRWEDGKPVGRKTHAQGGGEIVSGDFLFNDDMAQDIISSATSEQLKGDLLKLAAESYRLYDRDCQVEANRESKQPGEKIIFRTMAWIKHALELKTSRVAGLTEARGFEAGARRRRPPVQEQGSRKVPDGWTTRRSRGGR
ncbi:MAG: hypothetical protein Q8R12_03460 [bacterium]|nr:hypothetical protein [bacterium]